MSNTTIKIKEIVAQMLQIPASEVIDSATFEELGADEYDVTAIMMEVEQELNLDAETCDKLDNSNTTVGQLIEHVEDFLK